MDFLPALQLNDSELSRQVSEIISSLFLSKQQLQELGDVLNAEMDRGLRGQPSSLQMENTYIPDLGYPPDDGEYLALDLGGTQFRVLKMRVTEKKSFLVGINHYQITDELRVGPGKELFDFLAACIYDFLKTRDQTGANLPLGFCFSFPMVQKALDSGDLVTWTKSFNCVDVVGMDAARLLKEAIDRRGDLKVDVDAIMNDTSGTLVTGVMQDPECLVGFILATGCNACYVEKVDNLIKWTDPPKNVKEVIVDIEWGAFGDNGALNFLKTKFDKSLDDASLIVGSFTFEKMFSGKFLGELFRYVFVDLVTRTKVCGGHLTEPLKKSYSIHTSHLSAIDPRNDTQAAKKLLSDVGYCSPSDDDLEVVQYLNQVITNRGALIIAKCLAELLIRLDRPHSVTIAVDGSMYRNHTRFRELMNIFIAQLAPDKKFQFLEVEDGSGIGAALVAALACRTNIVG